MYNMTCKYLLHKNILHKNLLTITPIFYASEGLNISLIVYVHVYIIYSINFLVAAV